MESRFWNVLGKMVFAVVALQVMTGCAGGPKEDPYEKSNRAMYKFDDQLDKYVGKPVSEFYKKVLPKPVRSGIHNAFANVAYGDVVVNDFLQGKFDQGGQDTARMAANSSIGLLGFIDVAGKGGLPAHENDFGVTLGKWGLGSGPYLVLPVLGPSTARDVPDYGMAVVTNPLTWVGMPWYVGVGLGTLDAIDGRSQADAEVKFRDRAAIDPYVFTRNAYTQYRNNLIYENKPGHAPPADENVFYEDMGEGNTTTQATTKPAAATQAATQPATAPAH